MHSGGVYIPQLKQGGFDTEDKKRVKFLGGPGVSDKKLASFSN